MPYLHEPGIYYERTKGDPTLIFLHGATLNHTVFNNACNYFAKRGYGTLAWDMHGHGYSAKSFDKEDYALEACTEDLERIVKKEKIRRPVVIGYSAGSLIAQQYAAQHDDVQALVLIAAMHDPLMTFSQGATRSFLCSTRKWISEGIQLAKWCLSHNRPYYPNYCTNEFRGMTSWEFFWKGIRNFDNESIRAYSAFAEAFMMWNTTHHLAGLSLPAMIIAAEHDIIIPLHTAYDLAAQLPNPTCPCIVPGTGHGLVFTHPAKVNKITDTFLKGLRLSK